MEILVIILSLIVSFISSGFEASYLKGEKEPSFEKDFAFISTTLFVNTLANNFGAIFFAIFLNRFAIEQSLKSIIEISVFTAIILLFCETLPKSIAFYYPQIFYNPILKLLYWNISFVISPILKILNKIFPPYKLTSQRIIDLKDILMPLRIVIEKEFWREQKLLIIQELISLMHSDIKTFIVPYNEVELVSYDDTVQDVVETFKRTNYRYFPVYKHSRNNIIGIVDISDLVLKNKNDKISSYIKEVLILLDNYPAFEFLKRKYEFAVVYDEFGNFLGIVKRKDILRNVFNIYTPNIREIAKNVYIIEAPIDLGLIEELTNVYLGEPNKNLNEFLMELKGEIDEGDEFRFENVKITILSKNGNYVDKIKLQIEK